MTQLKKLKKQISQILSWKVQLSSNRLENITIHFKIVNSKCPYRLHYFNMILAQVSSSLLLSNEHHLKRF